ncbi:MAG: STAS domain-containing protein [Phycisphaeraceae bacterium]|nr:STAS domain-containing protein [Phycisphaeraceae bacterium]
MVTKDSRLTINPEGDIIQVGFQDRNILEEAVIQQIGDEVGSVLDRTPNPKMLINFQNVEHLSSAALGMLITINNKVRQKGGQLRLACIDPQIYEVFAITKLNKLFQIFDDAEKAGKSFK